MKELIEFMARAIVENPDAVEVTEEDAGDHFIFYLKVADDDMGRVIGKQGRIANAMRTMLKVAAIRRGVRAVLEIGDARAGRGAPGRGSYSDRDDYDRDSGHDEDAGYGAPKEDTGHDEGAGYDAPQEGAGHDDADAGYNAPQEEDGHDDEDAGYTAPQTNSGDHDEDDTQADDQHDGDNGYGEDDRNNQ